MNSKQSAAMSDPKVVKSQLKGSENIGGHVRWQRNDIGWTDLTSKCDQLVLVTEKRETE